MNPKTATLATIKHYQTPGVKETIMRLSGEGNYRRWGKGDEIGWYRYTGFKKFGYDLTKEPNYISLINTHRTLYWTLNYFDRSIFQIDYNFVTSEESPIISRECTRAYTFGVDIDTIDKVNGHGTNIRDPVVKKAVETMAQYFTNRLRELAPNSVHVLFSGGGIYVMLHHEIFKAYFERFLQGHDNIPWERWLDILLNAFNMFILEISKNFEAEYPEFAQYAKADILNNSKRVFKCIFSIHAKHSFAVIPLNPDAIEINFDDVTLPLRSDVIERGRTWYSTYDKDNFCLNHLKPYFEAAKQKDNYYTNCKPLDFEHDVSSVPIPYEQWPPCIKNILSLPSCGEGRTRTLAFLAAFLGQVGVAEDDSRDIFFGLASRWGATTSNIFESYYCKMHTPSCIRLRYDDNTGFPRGVSIKKLNVCKPGINCSDVPSPRYYADKQANLERIKKKISHVEVQPHNIVVRVNRSEDNFDIYIGRANINKYHKLPESKWHNPFKVNKDGTREQVIEKYHEYLLQNDDLLEALPELHNKVLGCWCKPDPCHGDILAKYADIVFEASQAAGRKLTADEIREILTLSEVTP